MLEVGPKYVPGSRNLQKHPMKSRGFLLLATAIILVVIALYIFDTKQGLPITKIVVKNLFGRRLNEGGISLVAGEGYIANPEIKLTLNPPTNASFPATAILTADNDRLYFDLSPECLTPPTIVDPCPTSTVGHEGPRRVVTFSAESAQVIYLSIFPRRTLASDEHDLLTVQFTDSTGSSDLQNIAIRVIGQDNKQPPTFRITLDFSQDTTGFFSDPILGVRRRNIAQQAADDWAYYIDGNGLDTYTTSPMEQTWVWNSTGITGSWLTGSCIENKTPYTGFLIYVHGVDGKTPPFHSAGNATSAENCPTAGHLAKHGIPL